MKCLKILIFHNFVTIKARKVEIDNIGRFSLAFEHKMGLVASCAKYQFSVVNIL